MPDYQEMHLHLMRETEKAAQVQQDCEEIGLDSSKSELNGPGGTEAPDLGVVPGGSLPL